MSGEGAFDSSEANAFMPRPSSIVPIQHASRIGVINSDHTPYAGLRHTVQGRHHVTLRRP
jgi:hypothetical protein